MPKVLTKPKTKKSKPATPQLTKIEELQDQILQLKKSTETKLEQIDEYRTKRAELVINEEMSDVNKRKIASIDAEINRRVRCIENFPAELKILENEIAAEEKRIADSKRSELLAEQRVLSDEIEETSRDLCLALEHACKMNDKLVAANDRYNVLKAQTGVEFCSENVTQGSRMFLKVVRDYCVAETNGERPARPVLHPPYQFI